MSGEPELEAFDFADVGTTDQLQATLAQKAKGQDRPPAKMTAHALPDIFVRGDRQVKATLTDLREWAIGKMTADDPSLPLDRATVYFDLWLEYQEAQQSIDMNGIICLHPRTATLLENPYVARRDRIREALAKIRDVRADWLWVPSNIDRVRTWLDQSQADRDNRLSPAERQAKRKMETGE
mgnify:FL=1